MKEGKKHHFAVAANVTDRGILGFAHISTKVVLAQIPPVSIAFFRYSIRPTLIPQALLTHSLPKITLKELRTLTITSLLGIVRYFLFEK
jgi:hypothetical protein